MQAVEHPAFGAGPGQLSQAVTVRSMVQPRILVVDDEQDIRELLRMAFEVRGWLVTEAGDLRESSGFRQRVPGVSRR